MLEMLEETRQLQEECLAYSRSKVDVATQNFDIVSDKQPKNWKRLIKKKLGRETNCET